MSRFICFIGISHGSLLYQKLNIRFCHKPADSLSSTVTRRHYGASLSRACGPLATLPDAIGEATLCLSVSLPWFFVMSVDDIISCLLLLITTHKLLFSFDHADTCLVIHSSNSTRSLDLLTDMSVESLIILRDYSHLFMKHFISWPSA